MVITKLLSELCNIPEKKKKRHSLGDRRAIGDHQGWEKGDSARTLGFGYLMAL